MSRSAAGIRAALLALAIALIVQACGGGGPSPSPGPVGTPGPTPGTDFTPGELRLLLVDVLGPRWWCDPDEYPVGRDEQQSAIERWDEMRAEGDVFTAVLNRLGFDPNGAFDFLPVGQSAIDSFTYTISDGNGGTDTATVSVTVTGENDPPVAVADSATVDEDAAATAILRPLARTGDPIMAVLLLSRRAGRSSEATLSTPAPTREHAIGRWDPGWGACGGPQV